VGWHTHWYATAAFGQLKPGTGLLLDMGATVTITSLTVQFGPRQARSWNFARRKYRHRHRHNSRRWHRPRSGQ
jgi:hypothetical protein